MYKILSEDFISQEIQDAVEICKSSSGFTGSKLRKAHEFLGETLALQYKDFFSTNSVVISFLRAGLPFSYGFVNIVDCSMLLYDSKQNNDFMQENESILSGRDVILIDSVVNTGKSIIDAVKSFDIPKNRIKIVTNVLCERALTYLQDYDLFTVRISENSFQGGKVLEQKDGIGPDTGDRLFKT